MISWLKRFFRSLPPRPLTPKDETGRRMVEAIEKYEDALDIDEVGNVQMDVNHPTVREAFFKKMQRIKNHTKELFLP